MKHQGIILNSNQYKDFDEIIGLITPNGFISFNAKGIRKPNAKNKSLIFDFSFVQVELFNKNNKNTLINGKLLLLQNKLYTNYNGLIFINFIKEIIIKLMLDEEKHLIYHDLLFVLNKLSKIDDDDKFEFYIYLYILYITNKVLKIIGYDYSSYSKDSSIEDLFNSIRNKIEVRLDILINKIFELINFIYEYTSVDINSKSFLKH